jgi:hypothetical protein
MIARAFVAAASAAAVAGCSGIQFSSTDNGRSHPYRVASPALKVAKAADCTMTAEVISIPGRLNYMSFHSGLGKSDTTVIFEPGGTIKQISAKQEGVADDLVKLIGAAKSAGVFGTAEAFEATAPGCTPSVVVYPVVFDPVTQMPRVDETRPVLRLTSARE